MIKLIYLYDIKRDIHFFLFFTYKDTNEEENCDLDCKNDVAVVYCIVYTNIKLGVLRYEVFFAFY